MTTQSPPAFPAAMAPTPEQVPALLAFADATGATAILRGATLKTWLEHQILTAADRLVEQRMRAVLETQAPKLIQDALSAHDGCAHRIAEHLHAVPGSGVPYAEVTRSRLATYLPDPLIRAVRAAARRQGITLSEAMTIAASAWIAAQADPRAGERNAR